MQQNYFISLALLNIPSLIVNVIAVENPFVDTTY